MSNSNIIKIILDIMLYHILIKMNIRMLESCDVHLCSVFWKREELFLVPEWDMNDHCTLIQHIMVNKKYLCDTGVNLKIANILNTNSKIFF